MSGVGCSARDCKNNTRDNYKLSFFRFPKEQKRCNAWIRKCRRTDLDNRDSNYCYMNLRLCCVHFTDKMFSSLSKNKLKRNAIPTLFYFKTEDPLAMKFGFERTLGPETISPSSFATSRFSSFLVFL